MSCELFDNKVEELEISSSERDDDDILSKVVKKQEAALRKLEEKHGSGYGKPPAGSKSEARAKRYNENCVREIIELCAIISERGTPDEQGRKTILFEKIFNAYRFISDKCAGLLLRARRYKLLDFEGEMLFQGKDDKTTITMTRTFSEIHGFYKENKRLIGPEESYIPSKQVVNAKKVRKKVARKCSRGPSFRNKDKEKTGSSSEKT